MDRGAEFMALLHGVFRCVLGGQGLEFKSCKKKKKTFIVS